MGYIAYRRLHSRRAGRRRGIGRNRQREQITCVSAAHGFLKLVEHQGIAPCTSARKAVVYLSTPMLGKEWKPENTVPVPALWSDSPRPAGRSFPTFPRDPPEAAVA